jgi:hypothetical protein
MATTTASLLQNVPSEFPEIVGNVLPLVSSPTNIILFMILCYLAYVRLRPQSGYQHSLILDEPIVFKYYTPKELAEFDGRGENQRILLGIRGGVYDVTVGGRFYGPQGPYGNFAGRDASRGLSKESFGEGITDLN